MKRLILIALAVSISACAVSKAENNARAYYNRGNAWFMEGDFDRAISEYTNAIELNPRFADAYYNRGNAYRIKGQYDKAISDFAKAIELDPRNAEAYNNRAISYYMNGEYDKAWEDVQKAQSLGYQVPVIFLKLLREKSGLKDEQVGDLLGAEKAFEKNIDPQETCEQDCKKMFEKGELRQGMTVKECIKVLCE